MEGAVAANDGAYRLAVGLPVVRTLEIEGYGMYPGQDGSGMELTFEPGLTLVVGANGLGKSTLVSLLFRMLTGPFDIPRLEEGRELGSTRLEPVRITDWASGTFARRVSNGAQGARATVAFAVAGHEFRVERRLDNLALVSLDVDGEPQDPLETESYELAITRHARLGTFADWILLLRHVVFYFEDRRALVWDPSAQRQILRLLFLPASAANEWTVMERAILATDSRMRNLQAALGREERELAKIEMKTESVAATRTELQTLESQLDADVGRADDADAALHELDTRRAEARVRSLSAEQLRESRLRDLEQVKLLAVGAAFPSSSETARYILAQLMAGDECLVCGHTVPDVAVALSTRIEAGQCVLCSSPIDPGPDITAIDHERVARALADLESAERELSDSVRLQSDAEQHYAQKRDELALVRQRIAETEQRTDFLIRSLPPEEAAIHDRRSGLSLLRTRVDEMKTDLAAERSAFATFIEGVSRTIVERADEIKRSFNSYATGFLVEQCDLDWSPSAARVGQSGETISFPSFQLTLTGSDFAAPVRRSSPADVSESQREFIDLSFRMALMSVAGVGGVGTLVVDAPESSLDAVFSLRAAEVLVRFATATNDNRLIVTSNLVEGSLIPALARLGLPAGERDHRVVDLLELAQPTAAVRDLHDQYVSVRDELLGARQ